MVLAGSLQFDLSSLVLVAGIIDGITENVPPILFLALIGVCAIMIVAGAVIDMKPEREAGDSDADDLGGANDAKKLAKAERLKAKAEAKARQKAEKAAAKAAKGKKGKSKAAAAPESAAIEAPEASDPFEPSELSPIESIDFSEPEQS